MFGWWVLVQKSIQPIISLCYIRICFLDIDIACFLEQKAVETIYYALTSICNEEEDI